MALFCVARTDIQIKKETKTENANADVIVRIIVETSRKGLLPCASMSPSFGFT
jgi:hypothetical protein